MKLLTPLLISVILFACSETTTREQQSGLGQDSPNSEERDPERRNPDQRNSERRMVFCAPGFDPATLDAANAPIFEGLGTLHYKITTSSDTAQRYFNQGLTLMYAFNHGEAGRSFKAAIANDSTCAMAYWGLAMILGPNYNAALNPMT
ncbi:MAG: hypothetical protein EOP49_29400 [Sphingobacteriales bacterium]|nr:MAG: hypothetical protein EOP49_29400 [Sphingobacteriales bacterium]